MKNRTKCFLTVLITYLSMCLGSWLLVYFLITAGSEPIMAIIAGFIASLGLSTAGILLRKQPKSVLLSYALTIVIAWCITPLVYFVLGSIIGSSSVITEIINISLIAIGFPGFIFGMAMGENSNSNPIIMYFVVYGLCGLLPVIITFVSTKVKKSGFLKK